MARYADKMLADGERVILRTRQHWLAPIITGRTAWAILIASVLLIALITALGPGTPDWLRTIIGSLSLGLLVVALAWLAIVYWGWYLQDYMVTSRRVLKVEGILRKRSADSSLEKINDAILEQSLFGRLLGYGDLEIMTAAETPVDHYSYLRDAPGFKRTMLDAKHSLEQEVANFPGPPLRAAPSPAGAPAAAASKMSSDEITRALNNLADLRDRGAISADDYEAKKQDLLGRL